MISSKSKHKDQAFQVIQTVMSDEIQVNLNRLGRVTSLSSIDVKKTYGTGIPSLKGKNLAASYALKPAWNILSDYDDDANKITFNRSLDLYKGKDINTVIRETEEEITKAIEQSDRKKNRPEGDIVR
jgi:multiple sugar transport system substrate-binding protein